MRVLTVPKVWVMVDKNHVFVDGKIEAHMDAPSFQVLSRDYFKDKNNIYYIDFYKERPDYIFAGVDHASFQALSSYYAKDKDNVFYFDNISQHGLDPATFKVLNDTYLLDKSGAYYNTYSELILIPDVDYDTFKALNSSYARDKNHVYYATEIMEGALPEEFEIIADELAKDKNHLYQHGELIENSDPASFRMINKTTIEEELLVFSLDGDLGRDAINYSRYFVDNNNAYYESRAAIGGSLYVIEEADPNTFTQLTSSYAKDKNQAYYLRYKIEDADVESFEAIAISSHIARDKNHVYIGSDIVKGADPSTFKLYEGGAYSKDAQHAFYGRGVIPEADATSFELLFKQSVHYYGKDKNHVFYQNKIIPDANAASFEHVWGAFTKDQHALYFKENLIEGTDAPTLELLSDCGRTSFQSLCIMKDKNRLYITDGQYNYGTFNALDLDSFVYLSEGYIKDKDHIYYLNGLTYNILDGADLQTFQAAIYEKFGFEYGKDAQYCYNQDEVIPCPKDD